MAVSPKVILVTMFEPANRAGELTFFRERLDLEKVELAGTGLDEVYVGCEGDILAVNTGVGSVNTAIAAMALGLCPEVDASASFWLITGIAGADPAAATLGSPVWTDWCVDGDFAFEIDAREIPNNWSTGILPLGAKEPFGKSDMSEGDLGRTYHTFEFNHELVKAAHDLTLGIDLVSADDQAARLAKYGSDSAAAHPPAVMRGDCLSAARYFHGERATVWARQWVKYWTGGKGNLVTCGMEDSGTLHAIGHLHGIGLANRDRVLLLRTVSNFTHPPPGECPTEHFNDENTFPAFDIALENGYRVATALLDSILENWEDYNSRH